MTRVKMLIIFFFPVILIHGQQTFKIDGTKAVVGQTYTSWTICFDLVSSEVIIESTCKLSLDSILAFLKSNPTTTVELGYHTNDLKGAKFNLTLSQQRAESVKRYFVGHGIDSLRMVAVGYGSTKPLTKEDRQFENEFKKNNYCTVPPYRGTRRLTIKILSK
ncbi:MAG: OmpA family protein [Bacteroidia bacterium]|nr:OmpA family protein [Bacteroidia bacterium]